MTILLVYLDFHAERLIGIAIYWYDGSPMILH